MTFLQNRDICFNQGRLSMTYHDFHHKSLVRPKSKIDNDLNAWATLQTNHVDSTMKQGRNGCFLVVSTWNPRSVFVGNPRSVFVGYKANFFMEKSDAFRRSRKKIKLTKISKKKLRSDHYLHAKWPKITNIYLTSYMDDFLTEL